MANILARIGRNIGRNFGIGRQQPGQPAPPVQPVQIDARTPQFVNNGVPVVASGALPPDTLAEIQAAQTVQPPPVAISPASQQSQPRIRQRMDSPQMDNSSAREAIAALKSPDQTLKPKGIWRQIAGNAAALIPGITGQDIPGQIKYGKEQWQRHRDWQQKTGNLIRAADIEGQADKGNLQAMYNEARLDARELGIKQRAYSNQLQNREKELRQLKGALPDGHPDVDQNTWVKHVIRGIPADPVLGTDAVPDETVWTPPAWVLAEKNASATAKGKRTATPAIKIGSDGKIDTSNMTPEEFSQAARGAYMRVRADKERNNPYASVGGGRTYNTKTGDMLNPAPRVGRGGSGSGRSLNPEKELDTATKALQAAESARIREELSIEGALVSNSVKQAMRQKLQESTNTAEYWRQRVADLQKQVRDKASAKGGSGTGGTGLLDLLKQ